MYLHRNRSAGQRTFLNMGSADGSTLYIMAVDERVEFMKKPDYITKDKVSSIFHHIANFFFFFIIQHVKACTIPCPHQPPTRGDNTVSVAQGGSATPGATKQLLPPDRVLTELYIYVYIYIYIYKYTSDQLRPETTLDINLHF